MSLAIRLLLALGAVAVLVTALVGIQARNVARREVEHGFEQRISAAVHGARSELVREARTLSELLEPMCKHDSFVDHTLVELEKAGGRVEELPAGRGLALRRMVPEQKKALRLDELILLSGSGEVVGASDDARLGTRARSPAEKIRQPAGRPTLSWRDGKARIVVHCARTSGEVTLGLVGAREVEPILARIGDAYGVVLSLEGAAAPPTGAGSLVKMIQIEEIPG